MKKILTACIMAAILMLVPVTVNAVTIDVEKNPILNNYNTDEPQMFITEEEYNGVVVYIEGKFEGEEKVEANNILDSITSFDVEYSIYNVDAEALVEAIEDYSYFHIIPESVIDATTSNPELLNLINQYWTFTDYPFANLIDKIVDLVKGRLGWIYQLFYQGGTLFIQGVTLAKQFIGNIQTLEFAKIITKVVNLLVSIPILYFSQSIQTLFNLDINGFITTISEFTGAFTTELSDLVVLATAILEQLGEYFIPLSIYVEDIGDFVNWVISEPWKEIITVKGNVINLLLAAYPNAVVSCREGSDVTDSQGNFEFIVNTTDNSEDSVPPNNYYGLHLCVITVSKNGEVLKQTPTLLSYVCSGGTIEWPFIVQKIKSKDTSYLTNFIENFNLLLQRFLRLSPIFA